MITDAGRNAYGFPNEARDCTVRATAVALQMPYKDAHARLKALGRKNRCRFTFEGKCIEALGLESRPEFSCRRADKVLPELAALGGRFIVRVSKHVYAVVDGTIYDNQLFEPNQKVKMVYSPKV